MSNEMETKDYVVDKKSIGEVKIASDVVTSIAAIAACEVDGVESMAGNITSEISKKLGVKGSKGVKLVMDDNGVRIALNLNIKYGYSIPKVLNSVQEKVGRQLEMMTGLKVSEVNVRVAGINLSEE